MYTTAKYTYTLYSTVASTSAVTRSLFMRKFRLLLGQSTKKYRTTYCIYNYTYITTVYTSCPPGPCSTGPWTSWTTRGTTPPLTSPSGAPLVLSFLVSITYIVVVLCSYCIYFKIHFTVVPLLALSVFLYVFYGSQGIN